MINLTATYLEAMKKGIAFLFSGSVGSTTIMLKGPGSGSEDGFPIPLDGFAERLLVYDGQQTRTAILPVQVNAGDRVSLQAIYSTGTFSVTLRINGASTPLAVSGCATNAILYATLLLQQKGD